MTVQGENSHVKTLPDNDAARWDEFVLSHELGTIYHTSMWRRLIRDAYHHRSHYLVMEDRQGRIRAGLPLFLIESRFSGNRLSTLPCAQCCNPLVSNPQDHDRFMDFVIGFKEENRLKYYELKTSDKYPYDSGKYGKEANRYVTYVLDIDRPLDSIMGSFHKSMVQRAIQASRKSGLELEIADSTEDVKPFFHLYLTMRKRYGLLPQPYRFFASMWKIMKESGNIEILSARFEGRIVSSLLLLKYKDTVTYEYGASNPAMLSLRPSHYLLWESIRRSHQQGYKKFDFGRTSDDNRGLSEFKARWGTTREVLPYYYIPGAFGIASARNKGVSKKLMYYSMRSLPHPLCNSLGGLLYKSFV